MHIGSDGNIVVAGRFSETATVSGGQQLTAVGMTDIFLSKYTPNGELIWSRGYGGPFAEDVYDVHIAISGAIYLSGEFQDSISIGDHSITSNNEFAKSFVARFSADGEPEWIRRTAQTSLSIDSDTNENLVVCGEMMGTINFMGDTLTSNSLQDLYVAKFSPVGDLIWIRMAGTLSRNRAQSIAVGENDNIYVGGDSSLGFSFAGSTIPEGQNHIFVLKYSPDGDELWIQSGTGPPMTNGTTEISKVMAFHPEWGLIIGGITHGRVSFGELEVGSDMDDNRQYLAKCQPDGTVEWLQGTFGNTIPQGLSIADNGGIYTIATFQSSTSLNEEVIIAPGLGTQQVIIAKYNSDGTFATAFQQGGEDHERAEFIHAVSNSALYFGGGYTGLAELGGIEVGIPYSYTPNAFFVKLNSFPVSVASYSEPRFTVYPNPAHNQLFISGSDILHVELYDLSGRKLFTFENSIISNGANIGHLAPGTYLVAAHSKHGKSTKKLIVQ